MLYTSAESGVTQMIALWTFYFSVERDSYVHGEIMLKDQEFMQLFILILILIRKYSLRNGRKDFGFPPDFYL